MSIIAAIDIGTNSVKMTVATAESGRVTPIRSESKTTRLGKDVDRTGCLADSAMAGTLDELKRLKVLADDLKVERIAVVGTSALRDASNGAEYLRRISDETGLNVEIVTGDREAELAYRAVTSDSTLGLDAGTPLVVFDLGGGSTELIFGIGNRIITHKSVDIGAVRITERCLHSDPPTQQEIDQASALAIQIIATAGIPNEVRGAQVAALGGTLVNLTAIHSAGHGDAHGASLSDSDVGELLTRLRAVPIEDRKRMPGIEPDRADVLIGGAVIALTVLSSIGANRFTVSTRGLRFGLLGELAASIARHSSTAPDTYPGSFLATPPETGRG